MKHVKKILLLFFLPTLLSLGGCNSDDVPNLENMTEQEIQSLFVDEWQEIERIDPQNPDWPISARGTTIIFFPDKTFQGIIISAYTHYSFDRQYLRMKGADSTFDNRRYLYSFVKNKLTLKIDSGNIPYSFVYPRIFTYKK
jgi:hypothetical protein